MSHATISASSVLTTAVEPIDAAVRQHLSQRYWDWRRLYEADPHAVPMQHPDYVLGEVQHAPTSRLQPVLISARHHDVCVGLGALIPKVVASKRLGGVGLNQRWHGLRLAGNAWLTTRDEPDAVRELVATALQHVRCVGARFLLIEDVDVQSPLATALREPVAASWLPFHHAGVQPRWRIQLPATAAEYWGGYSKKTLSTMRRKLKKFGETRLERITDISQVARFLEIAHEISLQTWQTRQFGLRIRNDAGELELFTTLAQHGLLRSYLWFSNGQPVGFLVGHQDRGRFHYEEVGYATQFAKYSPGQTMLVQVLDDLFAHDRPEWFDFGGGDADYKQFFANHESQSGTVWLFPPTAVNRGAVTYLHACRAARQWARRAVAQGGWANRARQWVRYGGAKTASSTAETMEE
jgi:hypothetical protein